MHLARVTVDADAGTVGEILKGGGGKLSIETNDTGDIRKPKGQG